MTTIANSQVPVNEPPPVTEVGVVGWLKHNLFNSWFDAILTFVSVGILYIILVPSIRWAFTEANWAAVTNNILILMHGPYPQDQNYRVLFCAIIIVVLGVVSAFVYRGKNKTLRQGLTIVWVLTPPIIWLILLGFTDANGVFPRIEYSKWGGLLLTFVLAIFGIVASFPLGVLLALGRQSNLPVIKWLSTLYIEVIRGVPLITVLFMAQIMLPLVLPADVRIEGMLRAMVGMMLFSAAYLAENVRGGLQAIPKGQSEAAQALGLNTFQEMYFIILPQALRTVIPPLVGQFISLFKDTSLVAIVGLLDFLFITKSILAQAGFLGAQREVYIFAAVVYFIFSFAMSSVSIRLERQLGVGTR